MSMRSCKGKEEVKMFLWRLISSSHNLVELWIVVIGRG